MWTPEHKFLLASFDNTPAKNKNRWMLGLLCMFVWFGWFERVDAVLMPPGHTHVHLDADRAPQASAQPAYVPSVAAAVQAISTAFRKPSAVPKVAILQQALNFKGLLNNVRHPNFKGHLSPLQFRFFRDASLPGSPVRMLVRTNSEATGKAMRSCLTTWPSRCCATYPLDCRSR